MKHKEIKLYPTQWMLDVWICDDLYELADSFADCYGLSADYYQDALTPNQVCIIKKSGVERIVMNIADATPSILAHELIHVIFKLSELSHVEICSDSQEWVAQMITYLWDEILAQTNGKSE